MNEIDESNLTDQTKFTLNKISKIENHFNSEIKQKKSCIKKLSKYVTTFGYIDKVLIVSFRSVAGASVGIASAIFALIYSLTTGIIETLLSITRNKKKKHYKTLTLEKIKLNSIKTLAS